MVRHAHRQEVAREAAVALALVLLLAACGGSSSGATVPTAAPPAVRIPSFTRVVLVVFENHEAGEIGGNPDAPTFNALARRYARLTSYDAVAHPSLPNYLALVSGSTQGITSDCTECIVGARSLADTLAAAGKTWKTMRRMFRTRARRRLGRSLGEEARCLPLLPRRRRLARAAQSRRPQPATHDIARDRLPDFRS